ncbi:MAG: transposase [Paraglaciecola sp.]
MLTKTLFKHQHEEIEMKLYGGIDLHSNNSVIAIKDDTGKVLVCKKLPNDWELIQLFLEPYKEMLIGLVIESTYNWYWLVDALIGAKFCVHLANTAASQQNSGLENIGVKTTLNYLFPIQTDYLVKYIRLKRAAYC